MVRELNPLRGGFSYPLYPIKTLKMAKKHKHKFYPLCQSDRDLGTTFTKIRMRNTIIFACECGITKEVDMKDKNGRYVEQID